MNRQRSTAPHPTSGSSARHRGYATATGERVRTGQLYRSTELNHLQGEDLERFAALGIRAVFDMRTAAEREAELDVVPEGTEQRVCDVLKDSQTTAPAQLLRVLSDPALAEQMLGGDNRDLLPALKPVFEHFRAAGGDPRLLEPVLGVDADYLRTALNELTQRSGSIEAYFDEGLGIDTDGQRGLRDALVGS